MIQERDRKELIKYRLEQTVKALEDAKLLIDNSSFSADINRVYYAIFFTTTALALKNNFKTSKHQQLIGWFNKAFIKEGKVDKKYGKIIRKAFEYRSEADYGEYVNFSENQVQKIYTDGVDFTNRIKMFIISDE
ncbi:MAG: HEPN domain-containing protein [Bacteroidales bacterium]|nr:HEPN domain-containing protein [Bacteroidales bacterium]